MAQEATSEMVLGRSLKPVCPRENHGMRYEEKGISWKEPGGSIQRISSYHCGHYGCSVRYTHTDGYFTVVDTPDFPHFMEEPGANVLQCPVHGTWLYRFKKEKDGGFAWRCGVEGCVYSHQDVEGSWFRPSELV